MIARSIADSFEIEAALRGELFLALLTLVGEELLADGRELALMLRDELALEVPEPSDCFLGAIMKRKISKQSIEYINVNIWERQRSDKFERR